MQIWRGSKPRWFFLILRFVLSEWDNGIQCLFLSLSLSLLPCFEFFFQFCPIFSDLKNRNIFLLIIFLRGIFSKPLPEIFELILRFISKYLMLLSIENGLGIIAGRIEHAWKTVRIQLMIDRQHRHDVTGKEIKTKEQLIIRTFC